MTQILMTDEQGKPKQEETGEVNFDWKKPEFLKYFGYLTFPQNVEILETTDEQFDDLVKKNPDELKKELGKIGTYCVGGVNRSRILGKKLNEERFVFADEKSKNGRSLIDVMDEVSIEDGVLCIGGNQVDTVIFAVDTENDSEVSGALASMNKLSKLSSVNQTSLLKKPLTILFVSTPEEWIN